MEVVTITSGLWTPIFPRLLIDSGHERSRSFAVLSGLKTESCGIDAYIYVSPNTESGSEMWQWRPFIIQSDCAPNHKIPVDGELRVIVANPFALSDGIKIKTWTLQTASPHPNLCELSSFDYAQHLHSAFSPSRLQKKAWTHATKQVLVRGLQRINRRFNPAIRS